MPTFQETQLFSHCANGKCTAPFDYRKGRLFRFPRRSDELEGNASHALVHFWLCSECSQNYTLEYRARSGVAVLRLKRPSPAGVEHKSPAEADPVQVAVPLRSQ